MRRIILSSSVLVSRLEHTMPSCILYKMKSHTVYVRSAFIKQITMQIANYKRFKKLTEKWIRLGIEHSKKKMAIAKLKSSK